MEFSLAPLLSEWEIRNSRLSYHRMPSQVPLELISSLTESEVHNTCTMEPLSYCCPSPIFDIVFESRQFYNESHGIFAINCVHLLCKSKTDPPHTCVLLIRICSACMGLLLENFRKLLFCLLLSLCYLYSQSKG